MSIEVVINLQVALTHNWPEAPEATPVAFLRNEHRHVFHITAWKPVQGTERDIEILTLKGEMLWWLESNFKGKLGSQSCEWLAQFCVTSFGLSRCRVLEDGENGAEVSA